jgi:hypothetical protein
VDVCRPSVRLEFTHRARFQWEHYEITGIRRHASSKRRVNFHSAISLLQQHNGRGGSSEWLREAVSKMKRFFERESPLRAQTGNWSPRTDAILILLKKI